MTSTSQPVSGVTTPSDPTILQDPSNSNPELSKINSSSRSNISSPIPNPSSTFLPNPNPTSSTWIPKEIPTTFKASLAAWINHSQAEGAEAELHLLRKSGYFNGATLSNSKNLDDFDLIYQSVSSSSTTSLSNSKSKRASLSSNLSEELIDLEERERDKKKSRSDWTLSATAGTQVNEKDGKVGVIRAVDLGRDPRSKSSGISSWFSKTEKRYVNQVEIGIPRKPGQDKVEEEVNLVLHGYGAGLGFYFQNIGPLASVSSSKGLPTRLIALDWLGMGRSARVPYHVPSSVVKQGTKERVEAAEDFFIDSLEQWRQKMGIKSMNIIAHSLGGYLSLSYASKFPERVDRLILVSPAGIPSHPDAVEGEETSSSTFTPKGNRSSMDSESSSKAPGVEQEFQDVQESIVPSSSKEASDQASQLVKEARKQGSVSESKAKEIDRATSRSSVDSKKGKAPKEPPRFSPRTRSVIGWLWEQNVSPFSFLRGSLAFSPMLAGRYTSRRFGALPTEDLHALHAYCYSIFSAKGSSEYALAHLLSVGAHARWPQVDRMEALGKTQIPISVLYGSDDWMDLSGGKELVKRLKEFGNVNGSTFVVPKAGHHIYLDNAKAFNKLVAELLSRPLKKK